MLVIIFVVLVMPGGTSGSPNQSAQRRSFPFANQLRSLLDRNPSSEFSDDFRAGLEEWTEVIEGSGRSSRGPTWEGTYARFSGLRLWRPTLDMTDYQVYFQGEIETRAMSWAFRATDDGNYYATKVILDTASANHRAEIAHYSMVDGKAIGRVTLPLPFHIEPGTPYEVHVQVENDKFLTTINGQVVDTWRDNQHVHGGVGFFSDPGESALINWVRVTAGSGFLGRLLSFSLVVAPHDLVRPMPR